MQAIPGLSVSDPADVSEWQEVLEPALAAGRGSRGSSATGPHSEAAVTARREARPAARQRRTAEGGGPQDGQTQPRSAEAPAPPGEPPCAGSVAASGLVIYAKTGRSTVDAGQDVVPDAAEEAFDLGFRFPSATDIGDAGLAAASVLGGDPHGARSAHTGSGEVPYDRVAGAIGARGGKSSETLECSLRISAGAVSLSVVNPDRASKRAERDAQRPPLPVGTSSRLERSANGPESRGSQWSAPSRRETTHRSSDRPEFR